MKKSPTKKIAKSSAQKLEALRRRIDVLDGRLVTLLNQRSRLAQGIGKLKHAQGSALYVPEREQQVLARLRSRNKGPLSARSLEAIYREIMSAALSLEGVLNIGVVGSVGSPVAAAARDHFGGSARYATLTATEAVKRLLAKRCHAVCLAEADLPAACAGFQSGRVRMCKSATRGVAVLVRT
ncbi:MAG TPA: chorismate mutase [Kiritimatiellia bacterium]|nr:chorismate mutase [Kiritimatiellia bacterium]